MCNRSGRSGGWSYSYSYSTGNSGSNYQYYTTTQGTNPQQQYEVTNSVEDSNETEATEVQNLDGFNQFETECLNEHNKYRNWHHASPLKLNRQLCNFATEWANYIAQRGVMQHRSNNSYGENIYMKYGTGNISVNGREPVESWYSEIKDYSFGYGGFSMNTGHFTQVVWKGSTELGVGIGKNSRGQIYVVANYNPPGNYQGQFQQNVLPR